MLVSQDITNFSAKEPLGSEGTAAIQVQTSSRQSSVVAEKEQKLQQKNSEIQQREPKKSNLIRQLQRLKDEVAQERKLLEEKQNAALKATQKDASDSEEGERIRQGLDKLKDYLILVLLCIVFSFLMLPLGARNVDYSSIFDIGSGRDTRSMFNTAQSQKNSEPLTTELSNSMESSQVNLFVSTTESISAQLNAHSTTEETPEQISSTQSSTQETSTELEAMSATEETSAELHAVSETTNLPSTTVSSRASTSEPLTRVTQPNDIFIRHRPSQSPTSLSTSSEEQISPALDIPQVEVNTSILIITTLLHDTYFKHDGIVGVWLSSVKATFGNYSTLRVVICIFSNFKLPPQEARIDMNNSEVHLYHPPDLRYRKDFYIPRSLVHLNEHKTEYVLFADIRDFVFSSNPLPDFLRQEQQNNVKAWIGSERANYMKVTSDKAEFNGRARIWHRYCEPNQPLPDWIQQAKNSFLNLNFFLGKFSVFHDMLLHINHNGKNLQNEDCGAYYTLDFLWRNLQPTDVTFITEYHVNSYLKVSRPYVCEMFGEVQFKTVLRSYIVSDDGAMVTIRTNTYTHHDNILMNMLNDVAYTYPHQRSVCIFCELDDCVEVTPLDTRKNYIYCVIPEHIQGRLDDHYITPFQLTLRNGHRNYSDESIGLCLHDRLYESYNPPPWDNENTNICTWTGCSGSSNVYGNCSERAHTIRQWLYILELNGVRQVYLYDTSRTYNNSLRPHLHSFIEDGFLTYIHAPVGPSIDLQKSYNFAGVRKNPYQHYYQVDRSVDCSYRFQNRSRFMMYMDSDELLIITQRDSSNRPYNISYMMGTYIQQFPIVRHPNYGPNVGTFQTYHRRDLLTADTYGVLLNQIWPCKWDRERRGNFLEWYRCGVLRVKPDHKTFYESGHHLGSYIHQAHYLNNFGGKHKREMAFMLDCTHGFCILHVRAGNQKSPYNPSESMASIQEYAGYADWISPYVDYLREKLGQDNSTSIYSMIATDVEQSGAKKKGDEKKVYDILAAKIREKATSNDRIHDDI